MAYRLTPTKKQKKRYIYVPKQIIRELKKYNWQPNRTNHFNFYHFLKKIKREINLPANGELTPHTLRRYFATYHAKNGLPLPLLSKMLGHSSVRTTALYWINTYHPDDDDSDVDAIVCGKKWLEKQEPDEPESKSPITNEIPPQPEQISQLIENSPDIWEINQTLNHYQQQLAEKDKQITKLANKLTKAEEQNTTLYQELTQTTAKQEQILAEKDQTIKQLEQELATEQRKRIDAENNLTHEKQTSENLRQQLQTERETNANLTQKLHTCEQNHANLINAYQIALKDKEIAEQQLNQLTTEIKNFAKALHQWQKINYYQQLEKEQKELTAQIIQPNFKPPPFK